MNNNYVLLQSGKGIGGIFRFLSNILLPVFRKAAPVIKKIAKSAPVKKGLKKNKKSTQISSKFCFRFNCWTESKKQVKKRSS